MNRILKGLSAVLILVAAMIAIYAWLLATKTAKPSAAAAPATQIYQSVIASRAIGVGETLGPDSVKVGSSPGEVSGGFASTPEVVGRVAVVPIAAGAAVLESQLNTGLAARVAQGERAVAIRIDEQTGVGNRIRPGDFVDVFVLLRRDGNEVEQSEARLLLPRLRVLSFGSASVDGGTSGNTKPQDVIRTAVLAVPVEEIAELSLGDNAGKLTLALRNPTDQAPAEAASFATRPASLTLSNPGTATSDSTGRAEAGVVLSDLIGNSKPRPAPKPVMAAPRTVAVAKSSVDVIRAGKLETVAY